MLAPVIEIWGLVLMLAGIGAFIAGLTLYSKGQMRALVGDHPEWSGK